MWNIVPQNYLPVFARVRMQAARTLISEEIFPHATKTGRRNYMNIRKLEKAVAVSGVFAGVLEEVLGKFRENCWKNFPESPNATNSRIWGKANLPGTLGPHCRDLVPTFRAGCFSKSTVQPSRAFLRTAFDPHTVLNREMHSETLKRGCKIGATRRLSRSAENCC